MGEMTSEPISVHPPPRHRWHARPVVMVGQVPNNLGSTDPPALLGFWWSSENFSSLSFKMKVCVFCQSAQKSEGFLEGASGL